MEFQFRAITEGLEAKDLEFFEFQQRIAPLAELKTANASSRKARCAKAPASTLLMGEA
jgi:glycine cleavage system pyridoxal-binding protein P